MKVIDIDNPTEVLVAHLRNPAIYQKRKNRMHIRLDAADEIERLTTEVRNIGEPWCNEGFGQAVDGECPHHKGDACLRSAESLLKTSFHIDFLCFRCNTNDRSKCTCASSRPTESSDG